jgi:hypothetical protein
MRDGVLNRLKLRSLSVLAGGIWPRSSELVLRLASARRDGLQENTRFNRTGAVPSDIHPGEVADGR